VHQARASGWTFIPRGRSEGLVGASLVGADLRREPFEGRVRFTFRRGAERAPRAFEIARAAQRTARP
jgi:hypothetical protein